MLQVEDIHTYYGDSYVLQGVSLSADAGAVGTILGRNGVGKTTLIRSIIGLTPPRRGKIVFNGIEITHYHPHRIAQMGVGIVPQGRRVFPSLTVQENLIVGAMSRGRDCSLDRIYSLFPILKERSDQKAGRLSGGEQQMLAMARALREEPDLLLMDEPSEGLAPLLVREIAKIIQQLKGEGISILLIEQDISFALSVATYLYLMSKGRIVYQSVPEELDQNSEIKAKYLGV